VTLRAQADDSARATASASIGRWQARDRKILDVLDSGGFYFPVVESVKSVSLLDRVRHELCAESYLQSVQRVRHAGRCRPLIVIVSFERFMCVLGVSCCCLSLSAVYVT